MVVPNAPVPVTAVMNIKVPVNVKLQPWRHARFFYKQHLFFNSASVLLNFLIN